MFRRRRNLSQKDLAAQLGISPPPMNALEKGRHFPSTPLLVRLAKALRVSLDQLVGEEVAPYVVAHDAAPSKVAEVQAEYKVGESWPTTDVRHGLARVVRLEPASGSPLDPNVVTRLDEVVNTFLALEDLCGVPKRALIPLRLPRPGTESGLENMVNRVRAMLGVAEAVIFDYLELFENAGLRVVFLPLPESVPSVSCYDPSAENAFFLVRIGRNMTVEHQLFRLAYELGRVFLYVAGVRSIACRQPLNGKSVLDPEHAARRFAAFFLMPAEAVHASVRQLGVSPNAWDWELLLRLKHRFGVSAETFLYRLQELDLVTPDLVDPLKTRIKAHYAETGNQEPDGSRRVLSPNGRLGDLLHLARRLPEHADEVARIDHLLAKHRVVMS